MWWFLSFVDNSKPEGEGFLGCIYVEGDDMPSAITNAWDLGINPGGEVLAIEVPKYVEAVLPQFYRNKLLDKEVAQACDIEIMLSVLKEEDR